MADFAILSFNVIARHGCSAAQMRIRRFFLDSFQRLGLFRSSDFSSQSRRVIRWTPQVRTAPIIWTSVIPEVCCLVLPRDGFVCIDIGAILHSLFRQRYIQPLGLPVGVDDGNWRDQHSPAAKPAAGFYHQVANGPCLVVEIQLIYSSNLAVRGPEHNTLQVRSVR